MPLLSGHGLSLQLPRGWDGAVRCRSGEGALPVLHASSMPLPLHRDDAGGGVVESLGWDDVFLSIQEHDPAGAGTALFGAHGLPLPLAPGWFTPRALQGMRPVQAGAQRFFSLAGRAFSLFVVVGDQGRRAALASKAERVLASLSVEARGGGR